MQCFKSGKCNFTFDGIASANENLKNSFAATPPETTKSEIFSWMEAFNTLLTMQDKVFIEDLEVETIIGIFGWERKVKQIVKISLEMDFNISDAAKTDNIDQALDYKSIGKDISSFVGKSSFQLVETMADKIAKRVLKNKSIEKVEVKVEKPGALRGSKSVGIKIVRKN